MKKKWLVLLTVPMLLTACNKADEDNSTTKNEATTNKTQTVRTVTKETDKEVKDLHLEDYEGRWMDKGLLKQNPTLVDHIITEFTAKGSNKAEIEVSVSLVEGQDTTFTKTVTLDENKKGKTTFDGGKMEIVLNKSGDDKTITLTLTNDEGKETVKAGTYEMIPYQDAALVAPENSVENEATVIAAGEEKIKMELSQMGEEGYDILYNDFIQQNGKKLYHYSLLKDGNDDATKYAYYNAEEGTVTFDTK